MVKAMRPMQAPICAISRTSAVAVRSAPRCFRAPFMVWRVVRVSAPYIHSKAVVVDDGATAVEVVTGGALLGWYWAGSEAARRWRRPSLRTWLVALSGLCLAAVWVSADFAWVSFAVFVTFATTLAPAPAVAAIVTMAAGTGAILVGRWPDGGHWAAQIVGPLVGAAAAGALVGVGRVAAAETAERQRLLDELLATRDDLARANLAAGAREERERLTGEIHDTLAQGFTSVVMAARRARRALDVEDASATAAEVDHIEELGRTGIDAARRLMGAMAPSSSTIARSVQRWRCWLSPSLRPVPRSSISASMEMMRAFPSGSKAPSCG